MTPRNAVTGTGTSTGTIYRASQTRWVMDLPAGSVRRLFDFNGMMLRPYNKNWELVVDMGLNCVHLHYEIGH